MMAKKFGNGRVADVKDRGKPCVPAVLRLLESRFSFNMPQMQEQHGSDASSGTSILLKSISLMCCGLFPGQALGGEPYINLGRLFEDALVLQLWSLDRINDVNQASGAITAPPQDRTIRTAIYTSQIPSDFHALVGKSLCEYFRLASYDDWKEIGRIQKIIDSWVTFDRPATVELRFDAGLFGKLTGAKAIAAIAIDDGTVPTDFISPDGSIAQPTKDKLKGVMGMGYGALLGELDSFVVTISDVEYCDGFAAFKFEASRK